MQLQTSILRTEKHTDRYIITILSKMKFYFIANHKSSQVARFNKTRFFHTLLKSFLFFYISVFRQIQHSQENQIVCGTKCQRKRNINCYASGFSARFVSSETEYCQKFCKGITDQFKSN